MMIKLHLIIAAAVVYSAGAITAGQIVKDSEVVMDAVKGGNLQSVKSKAKEVLRFMMWR